MIKVEVTEEVLREGTTTFARGDVITSQDAEHEATLRSWVKYGWAKDLATGEQGERKPGAQSIEVNDVMQDHL